MEHKEMTTAANFQVTYFSAVLDTRRVLIDKIDGETALAVLAKFGDKREEFTYLPDVQIERMPEAGSAA